MSGNKDYSITIRVRKDEYRWMESAAMSEDLSVSSFLRRIIVKNLRESFLKLNPNRPKWLKELEKK